VRYMRKTLQTAHEKVKELTGIEITKEDMIEAQKISAKLTMGYMNITRMMAEADPQPISQADLTLVFYLWSQGTIYVDDAIRALNDLQRDIRRRIKEGKGVVPKGAPRVYVELRNCVDMTPTKAIEELGLAIPVMFYDALHPNQLTPTKYPDDPATQAIEGVFKMPKMGDNLASLEFWKWMAQEHKVDGIIHMYASSCRPWSAPTLMGKKYVQKELNGIPYMVVEGDSFDSRNYSAGQMRTRVESFAEVLKMNKAAKQADKNAENM
jgi:benzoyl-CoA reductase/2-hydroxyglutaryl-CoA dehydratase subunit BcrC/BadD/HgdB